MTPPEVYIAVFRLADGKTMPQLSSPTAWRLWKLDRRAYADKRIGRWNNKTKAGRFTKATDFVMERYVRTHDEG